MQESSVISKPKPTAMQIPITNSMLFGYHAGIDISWFALILSTLLAGLAKIAQAVHGM